MTRSSYELNGCIIEHDGATLTCTVAASHWNGGHVLVDDDTILETFGAACIRHGYAPNGGGREFIAKTQGRGTLWGYAL